MDTTCQAMAHRSTSGMRASCLHTAGSEAAFAPAKPGAGMTKGDARATLIGDQQLRLEPLTIPNAKPPAMLEES
jgi:hypothetical protein